MKDKRRLSNKNITPNNSLQLNTPIKLSKTPIEIPKTPLKYEKIKYQGKKYPEDTELHGKYRNTKGNSNHERATGIRTRKASDGGVWQPLMRRINIRGCQ